MATFEGGNKQASALTQAEIRKNQARVIQTYRDALSALETELAKWYAKYLNGEAAANGNFYNIMIKNDRLNEMLRAVSQLYINYSVIAGNISKESSKIAFTNSYYREQYLLEWFSSTIGVAPTFAGVNPVLLETAVFGTEKVWNDLTKRARDKIEKTYGTIDRYIPKGGTITDFLINNRTAELEEIKRILRRDLLLGKSYAETTKDLTKIIGKEIPKNGQLILSGAKANAARIVRTEGNRNLNAGSYAYSKYITSNYPIEIRRQLLATLDNRVRRQSASMDGQTVSIDDPFQYPDGSTSYYPGNTGNPAYDINDRETVIDIVDGIDPQLRRARNPVTGENEVFTFLKFPEYMDKYNLKWSKSGKLVQK